MRGYQGSQKTRPVSNSNGIRLNSYASVNPAMLRSWRLFRRISREEAAAACGLTAQSVGRWERGEKRPKYRHLIKLSRLYDCDLRNLLSETTKAAWLHLESVLIETMLVQLEDMEEGKVPNLDFDQLLKLSDKLGVFDLEPEGVEERTEAEDQMGREIR